MSCECIDKIKKVLTDKHGINSNVDLDLVPYLDTEKYVTVPGLPPLFYHYTEGKKRKRSHVGFNFCPFCGKATR